MDKDLHVVILCGGKGVRMSGTRRSMPKPLATIGDKPILWHVMKTYSHYGFNNFILCLGYEGDRIREYFKGIREWNIAFVDTGLDTNTGGRIKRVEKFIRNQTFFVTYADGLSDINIENLLEFHRQHGRIATITVVKPPSPFGIVELDSNGLVTSFIEKPVLDDWINGGFFVFQTDVFRYIGENDVLEKEPFARLVKDKQLSAYTHQSFWKCMDTYKDNLELNEMWKSNQAKWALWKHEGLAK